MIELLSQQLQKGVMIKPHVIGFNYIATLYVLFWHAVSMYTVLCAKKHGVKWHSAGWPEADMPCAHKSDLSHLVEWWHDMTWHEHEHEHEHEHDFLFRGSDFYSKELCFKGQRITIKCSWFTSVPWLKETSQRGADWMRTATCVSMFYVLISCSWRFCHFVILPLIPCYLNMMTRSLMLNMFMLKYSVAMMVI